MRIAIYETFARIAAGADADVIVCGHTHKAYDKTVTGTRFVNVGSAGKPKDGSARSQIAEALLRDFGGGDFDVLSAGTEVADVSPHAIRVLADLGIDWSGARSKSITAFLDRRFDYVITVCDRARETCPVLPGSENTLHWGLDDPSEAEGTDAEMLATFRRTQLELSTRLRPFIEVALRAAGRRRRVSVSREPRRPSGPDMKRPRTVRPGSEDGQVMARPAGFEPTTPSSASWCSIH